MGDYTNDLLEQWDRAYIWHPFTQMRDYVQERPLVIERGEGSYLIDIEGNRYLDGVSSLWVNVHGHNKRELNDAIKEQVELIAHSTLLGLANVPSILLAKKLVEITPPGLNKVFYSDAGATSVEIALKMAFQYWKQKDSGDFKKKTRYIALGEAYHGDTIGSVSVGGMELYHEIFRPLLFDCIRVSAPYCYRCPQGLDRSSCDLACVQEVEKVMSQNHEEIAAMIVEPLVQGAAGIIVAPAGYLQKVRDLCGRYNILFIADEVAVGFGRTGKMFACQHEGVKPDLMCLAKGITGGYLPLAATLTTDEVYEAFLGAHWENKTFFHGHTYTGNPVACASALANIKLFEDERVIDGLNEKSLFFTEGLKKFTYLDHVGDIRQKGLMVGIELVEDKKTKNPYPPEDNIGHQVILEARKNGLIIRPLGNVIVLMPVLSMSIPELGQVLDITYNAISKITGDAGK